MPRAPPEDILFLSTGAIHFQHGPVLAPARRSGGNLHPACSSIRITAAPPAPQRQGMYSKMAMMSSFSQVQFNDATCVMPSPYFTAAGEGAFMIASRSSGLQWHVTGTVRPCLFGEVLKAVEVSRGGSFAIKRMSLERITRMQGLNCCEDPLKEAAVLQFLKANGPHPNVLEVVEVLRDGQFIYVVLPFCQGGELFHRVSSTSRLNEEVARPIFDGLLAGMAFLHNLQICHRDMSLENILLTESDQVKIIDFGMALRFGQPQGQGLRPDALCGDGYGGNPGSARSISPTGPFGKKHYMPPEVAMNEQDYDGFAVDVWALGVIMFITLAGVPPFKIPIPAEDQRCQVIAVEHRLLELVREWELPLSEEAVSLIQSCLLFNPSERSTVQELRNHPWFL